MEEKLFTKLLLEHKSDLAEIRTIALKFIKYAADHVKNDAVLDDELVKTINKEKFIELFIKMSSLIIKLIPLEQQVFGNNLISKRELNLVIQYYLNNLNFLV